MIRACNIIFSIHPMTSPCLQAGHEHFYTFSWVTPGTAGKGITEYFVALVGQLLVLKATL